MYFVESWTNKHSQPLKCAIRQQWLNHRAWKTGILVSPIYNGCLLCYNLLFAFTSVIPTMWGARFFTRASHSILVFVNWSALVSKQVSLCIWLLGSLSVLLTLFVLTFLSLLCVNFVLSILLGPLLSSLSLLLFLPFFGPMGASYPEIVFPLALFLKCFGFCSKFFVFFSLLFSHVMAHAYFHEFFYLILG